MTAVSTWSWSARAKCWMSWSFWYKAPFQNHAYLRSTKRRYEKQVFIVQVIEIAHVQWKSIATTFKAAQSIHELHVCYSNLMLLSRTVYSFIWWIEEMCLANCELHIPTLTFLIVLTSRTICQRQNQDVKFETSIPITIIASLSQLTRPRSQLTI